MEPTQGTRETPWHRMRDERDAVQADLDALRAQVDGLVAYLMTPKFHQWNYVNVTDVLSHLGRR